MKYFIWIMVMSVTIVSSASAQQRIQGIVIDAQTHEPLTGVSIKASRNNGAISGLNGKYTLTAVHADSLQFSFTGYQTQKVAIHPKMPVVMLQSASTDINEVVVSANREAIARTQAPIAISTISTKTIRETKATTLDQLLNKVSGVYMVNLGNEQHTMAIRQPIGYRSNYLYLEDGIPIRTIGDFNHNALIEINSAAVKTIEVIRGPSSSLYGSDAVGGAVNFITLSPSQVPTANVEAEGSDEGYKRINFNASNTFGKTGIFLGGYYANRHHGYMQHSDFDKLALTAKAVFAINERTRITLQNTVVNYNTDQTGALDSSHFYSKNFNSFYTFTYRKVNAIRSRASLDEQWNKDNKSLLTLYYRNNSIKQNPFYRIKDDLNDASKASGEINNDFFQSYGLLAQHTHQFHFWNGKLIGGLQFEYSPAGYKANYIAIHRNEEGYYDRYLKTDSLLTDYYANILNPAAYMQLELSPIYKLKITAALRYDELHYQFNNKLPPSAYTGAPDADNDFQQLSPKIGFTYDLGKGRGIYANYSQGFAPPDITDLYTGVKVPYLKPAHYHNYETGGWLSFNNEKGYLEVSLYHMDGRNEIIEVKLPDNSYINANAGKTLHYGIEYTLKYKIIPDLLFRFSGTNAEHRFIDYVEDGKSYNNNQMNGAPHWIFNTQATYKPSYLKGFRSSLELEHVSRYYMDEANTKFYKGYNLLNLRLGYQWKRFELWVNIINLGNTLYATNAEKTAYGESYQPGQKRTLDIGLAYHFAALKNK